MPKLTPEVLKEAVELIEQLRSGVMEEEDLSRIVERLDQILPDPNFMGYAVDLVPELSAEQVVRRAFEYRAFQL